MANLRTNNLSGEQGQNAYRGSVFFNATPNAGLQMLSSDFAFGVDDFTVEGWFWYSGDGATIASIFDSRTTDTQNNGFFVGVNASGLFYTYGFPAGTGESTHNSIPPNSGWHHFAIVRSGNDGFRFLNGQQVGSTANMSSTNYTESGGTVGQPSNVFTSSLYRWKGYLSNIRVHKGEAIYTSNFTPPTTELKATSSNCVLLCCQDSDDPTQDATGKTITAQNLISDQPKVIPPFGVDAGNTFGGPIQQSSQGYMYFPTGRTEERSRGFVVFGGGLPNTGNKYMDIVHIPTGGNTVNYGDLLNTKYAGVAVSSSTRGIWAGGFVPGYGGSASNVIESTELASHSNTTDFGDLTVARAHSGGVQNSTRGVFMTGYTPSDVNTIDFITMATKGDATDFGDVIDAGWPAGGGRSSSTRGVLMGHGDGTNRIQFITIMTTGNSQDFGDLNTSSYGVGAGELSDGLRGIAMGGSNNPGSVTNVIDFITIATTGNATEFGDLTTARRGGGVGCTLTKGILAGGRTPTDCNIIDSIVIQSTGNAVDFGDTTAAVSFNFAGCSDSHGGLT